MVLYGRHANHQQSSYPKSCRVETSIQDYRKPIALGDQVRVELRCAHLGHTSFALAYKVIRETDGVILAEAQTVQVMVDFATMRPRILRPQTEAWLKTQQ